MPPAFVRAFAPDADALLAAIAARIDDAMLEEIAAADYGMDVDRNLDALRPLRDRQELPPLNWHPREVLELIRWSEPDVPGWRPGGQGVRGHWQRAFACTALLRAYDVHDNVRYCLSFNETLVQLVSSIHRLDAGLERKAAAFLAWCIARYENSSEGELAFFGVVLLWFALHCDAEDGDIVELCRWADAQEKRAASFAAERGRAPGRWLLSTALFNQRQGGWEELGRRLAERDLPGLEPEARAWVKLIGSALAGGE